MCMRRCCRKGLVGSGDASVLIVGYENRKLCLETLAPLSLLVNHALRRSTLAILAPHNHGHTNTRRVHLFPYDSATTINITRFVVSTPHPLASPTFHFWAYRQTASYHRNARRSSLPDTRASSRRHNRQTTPLFRLGRPQHWSCTITHSESYCSSVQAPFCQQFSGQFSGTLTASRRRLFASRCSFFFVSYALRQPVRQAVRSAKYICLRLLASLAYTPR
ncbi:hypothetical protein PHSY_004038 [Pseudozyma hubeiensis SY62]|uniref:Uncharacterized protein n=1 Tax=Pseudozyma hubeiensis (strain SY62) TaxID=1305764 RepID=R9P4U3_PSEHS|nr:hypothetical protein PHSY_004038 [Pseudozyma hubeiensis SY62]GAC96458.1 hypothetical protein PHSY_004038 [Pseudozyma hubeiensis SY62]